MPDSVKKNKKKISVLKIFQVTVTCPIFSLGLISVIDEPHLLYPFPDTQIFICLLLRFYFSQEAYLSCIDHMWALYLLSANLLKIYKVL